MQVTARVDILGGLAASHGAEVETVLSELAEVAGEDVLGHHLRSAYTSRVAADHPDGPATWESRV
jgi:hypothetical protein